jgi:excisionase family DNA binding protein
MDDAKRSSWNRILTPGFGEANASPWLTVTEAADRARCGVRLIYREVRANRLRAARVGGRRELRLRAEWIDTWLDTYTTPEELVR